MSPRFPPDIQPTVLRPGPAAVPRRPTGLSPSPAARSRALRPFRGRRPRGRPRPATPHPPALSGGCSVCPVPFSVAPTHGIACCFLFLRLLRCFSSAGSPSGGTPPGPEARGFPPECRGLSAPAGGPIRRSRVPRLRAPRPGFSQLATAFLGARAEASTRRLSRPGGGRLAPARGRGVGLRRPRTPGGFPPGGCPGSHPAAVRGSTGGGINSLRTGVGVGAGVYRAEIVMDLVTIGAGGPAGI